MSARTFSLLVVAFSATLVFGQAKKKPAMTQSSGTEKPILTAIEPRGIQRGTAPVKIRLEGTNLAQITEVKLEKMTVKLLADDRNATNAWIEIMAANDVKRGAYELSVINDKGESGKVKLFVDDILQVTEPKPDERDAVHFLKTPASFWGSLNPAADNDTVEFEAKTGESLVLEISSKNIGSKANINITVLDSSGKPVASNSNSDGGDPLVACTIPSTGRYRVHISEEQMGGSPDHFYRLTIGKMPVVTGCFPLSVTTNTHAEVFLAGYNIPESTVVRFPAAAKGEVEAPVDTEKYRLRKPVKVLVTDSREITEVEPNDEPSSATPIQVPCVAGGRIWPERKAASPNQRKIGGIPHNDVDLFQFEAKAGEVWIIETDAARRGSPVDTRVEVLHADGTAVKRILLQAVRDSQINFRGIDSISRDVRVDNWEEMELNELMYLDGEVCKIFRMPQGPDSGFQFYGNGPRRICYFDSSAAAHANGSPCYIVQPHPLGSKLVPNGLPVFTLHYGNDDDGERELGVDSRVEFAVRETGRYLIRVTDTRGLSGQHFGYRLIVRPAKPDFNVTLNNPNPTVLPGSGAEFSVSVDRIDGFDGDITVDIEGMPEGFLVSKPLVIQAGHLAANGVLYAAADAVEPSKEQMGQIKVKARARIDGKPAVGELNRFGQIKLGEKPKLLVAIEPYVEGNTNFNVQGMSDSPQEITIAPGAIVPAWLKLRRQGHEDLVNFTVENLPHGVIVDNIGLNGVLIPKGEDSRQIFLRCAKWVPEIDRLIYCQARQAGNPTSLPILIKVRSAELQETAAK